MRLTLRTLLAYLDEILEPADAEELAKKIRESDFASGLVHRIRSSMGRLRLSAPKVIGKGMGTDPNSVAEYLDNTLPVERVPEFEKVCLESDMHLAEVASCHQILTLVLGEAAHVSPALRNRVYALGTESRAWKGQDAFQRRVDEAIAGATSGNGAVPSVAAPEASRVARPATPTPTSPWRSKRRWRALGLTLLLAFLGTTGWLLITAERSPGDLGVAEKPPEPTREMPSTIGDAPLGLSSPTADAGLATDTELAEQLVPDAAEMPDRSSAFVETPSAVVPLPRAAASPRDAPPLAAPDLAADVTGPALETPPIGRVGVPPGDTARRAPTPEPAAEITATAADGVPMTALAGTPEPPPLDVLDGSPEIEERSGEDFFRAAADPRPTVPRRAVVAANDDSRELPEAAAPTRVAADVGRNILDDQVLAYFDSETDIWLRLPAQAPLPVGQLLRVPVGFRPQLLLSNGMKVTLNGGTDVSFGAAQDARVPSLRFQGGQALLVGMGQEPGSIRLPCDQRELQVKLGDANAQFAIEVERFANPGTDPRDAPRHVLVQLWVTSGEVTLQEVGKAGAAETVAAGQRWSAIDLRKSIIDDVGDVPAWLEGAELSDIDRAGIREIEPRLVEDRSLTLTLSELAGHRRARTDVRSLSARCLASFDRYEPLVAGLGDARLHSSWTAIFEELRARVARDAHSAQLIADELLRTQGPDAEKTFRLLWGYTPAQLRAGGAADLVDDLEHEALPVRVLAIENLKQITGGMSLLFRPDRPLSNRRISVQNWRKRLEAGQIVFPQPPLVVEPDAF